MLVFQAERADDSTLGPKQGGGYSEKTLSMLPNTMRPNKKSKQTLAGLKDSEF